MADIIVTDQTPRVQYTASTGLPTVFIYPFPIFANTDLNVYNTPVGVAADDVTQILVYNVDYTVTNSSPPTVGGTITLTVGAPSGNIITIVRNQPDNRLNNYIAGGLFQATDVNTDFDRTVFMAQQNRMYDLNLGIHYNVSAQPVVVTDTVLPLLGANEIWLKNNANTAIVAYDITNGTGTLVNTVTGTANRITAVPTSGDVVVDIASTYVGQTSITTLGTISTGTWRGATVGSAWGGTGFSTYAIGDIIYSSSTNVLSKLAGNTTSGIQYLAQTGTGVVSAAPAWTTISGGDITGAALTETDDTNVTLTLGGSPSTALLRAASLTLGWTGQLALTRGGTNASLTASNGGIVYSTVSALAILAGTATAGQVLLSGASTTPSWSTPTYPSASGSAGKILRSNGTNNVYSTSTFADTYAASTLLYSNGANTVTGLATSNKSVLTTGATGVPVLTAIATDGQIIIGSTAGAPSAATLTAGSGVTITNAGNSITIAATGSGGTVTSVSGTANQINSTGGTTPVLTLSSTTIFPGTVTLNSDPVSALQAVTKQYADALVSGLDFKNPCVAATTAALTVIYSNGVAGVGATLTNAGTQAAFSIDGQTPIATSRVLIKNQASTFQNGIYTVTVVGTGATNWVLTRSLDYNTAAQIGPGDLVPVTTGTVNANTLWLETSIVTTIGTDPITFSQFSSAPLTLPVSVTNGGTGLTSTTVNQLLYSSSNNVIAGLATANSASLVTTSSGVPVMSSTLTNGQIIIGSTGATPVAASLTAGANITITPGAGTITIAAASGAAGAWTKVSTGTASSSASIVFTGLSNTYISYMVEFTNVVVASNTVDFYAVFGTGGTPTYQTSAYYGNTQGGSSSSGIATYNFSNAAQITINSNNSGLHLTTAAGAALDGRFYISNPSQSTVNHQCNWQVVYQGSGTETVQVPGGAEWRGTTAVTAIKFSMSSGNIASGIFTLYGLTG
jgi:hypothetical protein